MLKVNNIFRSVLETTPDTVLIIDENNVVVYCNAHIKYTFGYEPKDLIDRDMSILIPLELRERHKNGINRFLNSGIPKLIGKTVEIIGLHKNGNTFPIELSLSFWQEDGKIFFSSIIRDISESKRILKEKDDLNVILQDQKKEIEALFEEIQASEEELQANVEELREQIDFRKETEAALEKERNYLSAVLENIKEGIVACNEHGTLSFFNDTARKFHGLPEKPLPPKDWPKYYNLYQADGVTLFKMEETPLYKAYCGEEVTDVEMVIISTDGQKRNLMASGERITSNEGKNLGAVCVMQDITQKKREEELNNQLLIQETATQEALRQEKILLQLLVSETILTALL